MSRVLSFEKYHVLRQISRFETDITFWDRYHVLRQISCFETDITINLHKKSSDQTWGKSSPALKLVAITTIWQHVWIWQEAVSIKLTVKKYFKNPQLR